jgi:hypothetical protein
MLPPHFLLHQLLVTVTMYLWILFLINRIIIHKVVHILIPISVHPCSWLNSTQLCGAGMQCCIVLTILFYFCNVDSNVPHFKFKFYNLTPLLFFFASLTKCLSSLLVFVKEPIIGVTDFSLDFQFSTWFISAIIFIVSFLLLNLGLDFIFGQRRSFCFSHTGVERYKFASELWFSFHCGSNFSTLCFCFHCP